MTQEIREKMERLALENNPMSLCINSSEQAFYISVFKEGFTAAYELMSARVESLETALKYARQDFHWMGVDSINRNGEEFAIVARSQVRAIDKALGSKGDDGE